MTDNGLNSIYTLFILMGFGLIIKKRGVFNKTVETSIAKLLSSYIIPAMMIYNVKTQFTETFLEENIISLAAVFVMFAATIVVSQIAARVFRVNESREGIFSVMFSFSNAMFIGYPVITGIFGDAGIPYLMLFYIINTSMFWTVGVYLVSKSEGTKLFSLNTLKKILNPAFIGFLIGLFLMYTDTAVHPAFMKSLQYMSSLVTPLASLYMGSVIADINFKGMLYIKDTILIILGRFLVAPVICLLICKLLNFPTLTTQVFVIMAALPVMTNASVIAGTYGKDSKFAAFMTALTTFLSIFALPLYFKFM
ncbi:MAG: AEC family transporter [Clostridiaceae bacterium]